MPNEKKVVMLLDEVKKRGEELINKRDANATKEMIAAIQNLVLKVGPSIGGSARGPGSRARARAVLTWRRPLDALPDDAVQVGAMIDPTFSDFKKQQINKYSTEVKAKMKELVADAKSAPLAVSSRSQGSHPNRTRRAAVWFRVCADTPAVSQQLISGKIAPNVITPELRKLKATVGTLFTACEHLAMCVNLDGTPACPAASMTGFEVLGWPPLTQPHDAVPHRSWTTLDADLRALLEPREPQRHNTVKISVKATGNEALDSAMSGLNMIGVDPELAEMMKQAAKMEGGTETSAAKARAYAYYAGGGTAAAPRRVHWTLVTQTLGSSRDGIRIYRGLGVSTRRRRRARQYARQPQHLVDGAGRWDAGRGAPAAYGRCLHELSGASAQC